MRPILSCLALAVTLAGCGRTAIEDETTGCPDCTTLTGGLVFDGERCVPGAVVLRDGTIQAVVRGDPVVVAGAERRLCGATIVPGLIDLHTHVTSASGPGSGLLGADIAYAAFRADLRAGVTTVLDLGASRHVIFELRERIRQRSLRAPMLLASGPVLTPSGGHPCYAGTLPLDTCLLADDPSQGREAVVGLSDSADVVKVIIESGRSTFPLPRMSAEALGAIAETAQRDGLAVIAHVSHAADIDLALDHGVRIFAHLPVYDELTTAQAERLARDGAVVIPTLVVRDSAVRLATGRMAELGDPELANDVPRSEIEALRDPAQLGAVGKPENAARYEEELGHMRSNLRRCLAAGVTVAAGTDAGNLGVFHGLALHRELALYVEEGMTPADALRAATVVAADVAGLPRRGRIERGADADLLIVRGNPCETISAIRSVEAVFEDGAEIDRMALSLGNRASLSVAAVSQRHQGETCLGAGECGSGLACDARMVCGLVCESDTTCSWGAACTASGFPEAASTCWEGDGCDPFAQDCPNATACIWVGHGATRCWYADTPGPNERCSSWGGCLPGLQCDADGTCRRLCVPGSPDAGCDTGETCYDDSGLAGLPVGHCAP